MNAEAFEAHLALHDMRAIPQPITARNLRAVFQQLLGLDNHIIIRFAARPKDVALVRELPGFVPSTHYARRVPEPGEFGVWERAIFIEVPE